MDSFLGVVFSGAGVQVIKSFFKGEWNKFEFDLFISYPMKAFSDTEDKDKLREIVISTKNEFQENSKFKIFASLDDSFSKDGKKLTSQTDDFDALKKSKEYLLIYPKPLASSVLMELGCALCMNKRITIFVKNKEDLPYLMKERIRKSKNISIVKFSTYEELQDNLQDKIKEKISLKCK